MKKVMATQLVMTINDKNQLVVKDTNATQETSVRTD